MTAATRTPKSQRSTGETSPTGGAVFVAGLLMETMSEAAAWIAREVKSRQKEG